MWVFSRPTITQKIKLFRQKLYTKWFYNYNEEIINQQLPKREVNNLLSNPNSLQFTCHTYEYSIAFTSFTFPPCDDSALGAASNRALEFASIAIGMAMRCPETAGIERQRWKLAHRHHITLRKALWVSDTFLHSVFYKSANRAEEKADWLALIRVSDIQIAGSFHFSPLNWKNQITIVND